MIVLTKTAFELPGSVVCELLPLLEMVVVSLILKPPLQSVAVTLRFCNCYDHNYKNSCALNVSAMFIDSGAGRVGLAEMPLTVA